MKPTKRERPSQYGQEREDKPSKRERPPRYGHGKGEKEKPTKKERPPKYGKNKTSSSNHSSNKQRKDSHEVEMVYKKMIGTKKHKKTQNKEWEKFIPASAAGDAASKKICKQGYKAGTRLGKGWALLANASKKEGNLECSKSFMEKSKTVYNVCALKGMENAYKNYRNVGQGSGSIKKL